MGSAFLFIFSFAHDRDFLITRYLQNLEENSKKSWSNVYVVKIFINNKINPNLGIKPATCKA
jgi:hypothetical protein